MNRFAIKGIVVALPVLIVLLAAGCTPATPTETGTVEGDTPAPTGESSPEGESGVEEEVLAGGGGPFSLLEPEAGLDELTRYSSSLVLRFEGTPEAWSSTYQAARMDNLLYQRLPDGEACTTDDVRGRVRPEPDFLLLLPRVIGAAEDGDGSEEVNGIAASRYTFDQTALGMSGIDQAEGTLWVDPESGMLVKYVLTAQVGPDYLGEDAEGALTWEYTLLPEDETLPDGCEAVMAGIPVMDDAQDVVRLPGVLSFTTPSDVLAAAAFYEEQLAAAGWVSDGAPMIDERLALLEYTQGSQRLYVRIDPGEDGTTVQIILQEQDTAQ